MTFVAAAIAFCSPLSLPLVNEQRQEEQQDEEGARVEGVEAGQQDGQRGQGKRPGVDVAEQRQGQARRRVRDGIGHAAALPAG